MMEMFNLLPDVSQHRWAREAGIERMDSARSPLASRSMGKRSLEKG